MENYYRTPVLVKENNLVDFGSAISMTKHKSRLTSPLNNDQVNWNSWFILHLYQFKVNRNNTKTNLFNLYIEEQLELVGESRYVNKT